MICRPMQQGRVGGRLVLFTLLEMPALSRPVAQGKAGPRAYEPRLVVPSV